MNNHKFTKHDQFKEGNELRNNFLKHDSIVLSFFLILSLAVVTAVVLSIITFVDHKNGGTTGLIEPSQGGTGFKTYSKGELLIGNDSGSLTKNTLTAGDNNISIVDGDGTVTIDLSQDIDVNSIVTTSITTDKLTISNSALTGISDSNVTITLGGQPTTALLNAASITLGWQGNLSTTRGGTGIGSYTAGDMLYASNASTLATIAGNSSSTQKFLSQTSNGLPTWETISIPSGSTLSSSVSNNISSLISLTTTGGTSAVLSPASIVMTWTGQLGATLGGTGIGSYVLGDILCASTTTTLTKITGNITTSKQYLTQTGNGTSSAQPVWGGISTTDISGTLSVAQGGTGIASYSVGSMLYASGSTTLAAISGNSSATQMFLSQTSNGLPSWEVQPTLAVNQGGTGQTTYTNGQLLIGNTTGSTLTKATLTGTTNQVIVTNGEGSITLSLPQSISATSNVEFKTITVTSEIICSTATLPANATTGFLYIPTCAGPPTGLPNSRTGTVPLVFDTTNDTLCLYSTTNSYWQSIATAP